MGFIAHHKHKASIVSSKINGGKLRIQVELLKEITLHRLYIVFADDIIVSELLGKFCGELRRLQKTERAIYRLIRDRFHNFMRMPNQNFLSGLIGGKHNAGYSNQHQPDDAEEQGLFYRHLCHSSVKSVQSIEHKELFCN